jgi:hypothetical protein
MTRTLRKLVLPMATVLAVIVPAGSAQAATTYVCPQQGTSPSFIIDRQILVNTQKTVSVPDGTLLPGGLIANNASLTTGRFVEQFTNHSTKYSIAPAENGPNWFTDDLTPSPGAAASFSLVETGNNVNLFGPASEAALEALGIHVPVLTFTSGLLILHVVVPADGSSPYVDNFSLTGHLVDGCALLRAG